MTEEQKGSVKLVLELLRKTLIEEKVSLAVDGKGNISFFDTKIYVEENRFDGFKINIQELVK